jgi:hypothetical protein
MNETVNGKIDESDLRNLDPVGECTRAFDACRVVFQPFDSTLLASLEDCWNCIMAFLFDAWDRRPIAENV